LTVFDFQKSTVDGFLIFRNPRLPHRESAAGGKHGPYTPHDAQIEAVSPAAAEQGGHSAPDRCSAERANTARRRNRAAEKANRRCRRDPQLYSDLPLHKRAIVNARIAAEKKRLAKLSHVQLRELLVKHELADNLADARQCFWTKAEMIFELAALIVETSEPL
jgi:hypothetical protein